MSTINKSIDALLVPMGGHWHLLPLGGEQVIHEPMVAEDSSAAELAAWVQGVAQESELTINRLGLALPSRMCFAVSLPMSGFGRRPDQMALRYALEEHVPHTAEGLIAGFVPGDAEAFAVAAQGEVVRTYTTELASAGFTVEIVVPAALWLVQAVATSGTESSTVLLCRNGLFDMIICAEGFPRQWRYLIHPSPSALLREFKLLNAPNVIRCIGPAADSIQNELSAAGYAVEHAEVDWRVVTSRTGGLLAFQTDPWIELSLGDTSFAKLAHRLGRQLSMAVVAVLLLLSSICAWGLLRAHRDAGELAYEQRRQEEIFQSVAPGKPLPPDIFSRLSAELRGARGLAKATDESQLDSLDALQGLYALVESLPPHTRFQLSDIRIDASRTLIEGLAREHSDAEVVAAAVRKLPGWTVEPPRTQNLSTGQVSFVVNASPNTQPGGRRR